MERPTLPFEKVQASGNDFVLLEITPKEAWIGPLCDRHHGIGADGILVARDRKEHALWLDHYDPDGSRSFCLNGIRSALACLHEKQLLPESGTVHSEGVSLSYAIAEMVSVLLPRRTYEARSLEYDGFQIQGFYVHVGNPHFVITEGVTEMEYRNLCPTIRNDRDQFPEGTNVHLVRTFGPAWRVRSYERGVEGFTRACGSGMWASALVLTGEGLADHLHFLPDGQGEVWFENHGEYLSMWGTTRWVASGVWRC